jgi:predicted RNase H-like HicB family nuclease
MALRYYPALILRDTPGSEGYDVVFPDLPGCTSGGDTVKHAAEMAAGALTLHVEGLAEQCEELPEPSEPGEVPSWLAEVPGEFVAAVLVPVEMPGHVVRANITMDETLLSQVDAAAAAEGNTRSGFLAQAARERLQRMRAI